MVRDYAVSGYIPALDGMRGLAVMAVMLTHAIYGLDRLQGGSIGVDVFFVLSGFLITYLLVREYDRNGQRLNFGKFYIRRALRLGPALLLLLLALSIVGWILFDAATARSNVIASLFTLFYAANWARAFQIHDMSWLGHAWSLSIEEQFYLLWPVLLLVMLRGVRSRKRIVYVICAGALLSWMIRLWMALNGVSINRLYNGLDTRADSLLVGCALGVVLASNLIREEAKPGIASNLRRLSPVSAVIFAFIVYFATWKSPYTYYVLFVVVEVLVALTILQVFVADVSVAKSFLSFRPLVWVGTLSYGLYLWHFPIYSLAHYYGMTHRGIMVGTAATFAIAATSYYAMERPILRLKDRFVVARAGLDLSVSR
jgi:peptidoglycan/LPS O-acetylase OafA/YrhL